jgi:hypothetical protein
MKTRVRGLVALTGLALIATGCAGNNTDDTAQPTATATPVSPAPVSSGPTELAPGEVVLDSPADESDVKQCGIFTGRANLPADKTIVLGVRNKDNGSSERYFETVDDWEYPEDLKAWKGIQWFGDKDSAAGQSFRVEVLIADLALVREKAKAAKKDGWHGVDNPPGAKVAEHIDLHRVKGRGPAECY